MQARIIRLAALVPLQRLRLASGLVMLAFVTMHLANHALGVISVGVMEAVQDWRVALWRSLPGTLLLSLALATHLALTLGKFINRRTWRMPRWEAAQLALGLSIPMLLFPHVVAMRIGWESFGIGDNYHSALPRLWRDAAFWQTALVCAAWPHACMGLHFWLRIRPWYERAKPPLAALALLLPVMALAGFMAGAREAALMPQAAEDAVSLARLMRLAGIAAWAGFGLSALVLMLRLGRSLLDRWRPHFQVTYDGGITALGRAGMTLLEASRTNGVPHASICGGRGRCSTCRVRITAGLAALAPPDALEARVLKRIGAPADVRLACQIRPQAALSVERLLPAGKASAGDPLYLDKFQFGVEQAITVLFADLRGFTSFSESRLPYDVVFVLNTYLSRMRNAIEAEGGYVDKFIGDGVMALFGLQGAPENAAKAALRAARGMAAGLEAMNAELAASLSEPLRIGIGIHAGRAILGRIGVAGAGRITALGDTVNTASRLESACKELGAELVISQALIALSGLNVSGGRPESIIVKGREGQVAVRAFAAAADLRLG